MVHAMQSRQWLCIATRAEKRGFQRAFISMDCAF
jgi:hypothetical protein